MKRIIVAGLHHESNTFNPIITDEDDFLIHRGEEILSALNNSDSISGIIRTLQKEEEYEIIPIIMARAVPNGVIKKELYEQLKAELLDGIRKTGPVDAFTLSLHGSMRIQETGEAEGDILESIREIHPDIPIICSLDMHATITEKMLKYGDAFVGYKQAPHTDCFETGAHAAELTIETLKTGCKLTTGWCRIPMLIAGEQSETSVEPMSTMIEALRKEENREEILAASFLLGFPWADCSENGVCALVVCRGNKEEAAVTAEKLGKLFWETRKTFKFHTETHEPGKALEEALNAGKKPVYLSDSGDNPTAGSSADCTNFLRLILDNKKAVSLDPPLVYAGIYDPEAVQICRKRDGEITIQIGAKFDKRTSTPIRLKGRVTCYLEKWGQMKSDLVLFHTRGIDIIITSKHIGFTDTDMFDALGIDYMLRELIVVKLGYLTASHKKAASHSIMALTDGSSNEKLSGLPYNIVRRPLYPLDPLMKANLKGESNRKLS